MATLQLHLIYYWNSTERVRKTKAELRVNKLEY